MNRIDKGKRKKPSRVRRHLRAPNRSDSANMTRTISTSPSALTHLLKATKEKSDQRMLTRQKEKYTRIRGFFRSIAPTLALFLHSTTKAANCRTMATFLSKGLPS